MKKQLFIILAALLTVVPASARFDVCKKDAPRVYIGLRAAAGASMCYNIDDPSPLFTPVGGLAVGFKVGKIPLYIETGAYYMNMGTQFEDWDSEHYYWNHYDRYKERHGDGKNGRNYRTGYNYDEDDYFKVDNHSVFVPLVATYRFYVNNHISIEPFTGFYGSYGFDSENADFGLRDGLGLNIGHLHLNMGLNLGLVEQDMDDDDAWVKDGLHASLFLGIGLNF